MTALPIGDPVPGGPVPAFLSVASLDEALDHLAAAGDDVRILAGGTDLVLQQRRGELRADRIVHIGPISALRHVTLADGVVRIGALTSHASLRTDPLVARRFRALAEAAGTVGGWQTQAAGTLGGNVCNASPAADTLPPMLVADAQVLLAAAGRTRRLRVEDFVLGRRSVDRAADELVTGFELPLPPPRTGETYLKVAPRSAMEVALVGLAVRVTLADGGAAAPRVGDERVTDARVALCSVGPRPFRARPVEAVLAAGLPDRAAVAEAGALLAEMASPLDDARATAAYRRRILPALLARAIDTCLARARAS